MITKHRQTLILIAFILLITVVFTCLQGVGDVPTHLVFQKDGRVDCSNVDFSKTVVQLDGGMEHFPNQLLSPSDMHGMVGEATNGGVPYGSYRLQIHLPDRKAYTLSFPSIDYATRVYINGEYVDDIGMVAKEKEQFTPHVSYMYYDAQSVGGKIEIVLQYANYVHVDGGGANAITIGSKQRMMQRMLHHGVHTAMIMGCLGMVTLLLIGLFMFYPAIKGSLYFGLACLLLALRQGMVGEQLLSRLFPQVPWHIGFTIQYLSLCLLSVFLILFLHELYPKIIHKGVRLAVYGLSFVYGMMILLLDSRIYTAYIGVYQGVVQAGTIVYLVVRIAGHAKTLSFDQRISVAGMLVFFIGTVLDILFFRGIFLLPFGITIHSEVTMIVFILAHMTALFVRIQRQSQEAQERIFAAESRYRDLLEESRNNTPTPPPRVKLDDFGLAPRETELIWLLIDGKSRQEISQIMGIGMGTVNTYCTRAYKKMGCNGLSGLLQLFGMGKEA